MIYEIDENFHYSTEDWRDAMHTSIDINKQG